MKKSGEYVGLQETLARFRRSNIGAFWPLVLLTVGLASRFWGLGTPATVIFDELHWGRYFSSYFTGSYYFDVHPPLGKLIYAGWAYLWGFTPAFIFELSAPYNGAWALILRGLPAFMGAMLPLIVYGLALDLGYRQTMAALAGFLIAIDGAFIGISRLILLDPFLLFFGFAALWSYQRWSKTGLVFGLLIPGVFAGLAVSIKWTGLAFLGLITLLELSRLWTQRESLSPLLIAKGILALGIIPLLIYTLQFWIHFALLTHSGPGDDFMTPAFQATLEGSRYALDRGELQRPHFFEKFVELNQEMFRANARMTTGHPYSSAWYTWPLMFRPIFMWQGGPLERISLFGNPFIWWGSTIAVLTLLQTTLWLRLRYLDATGRLLLLGWLMNLLPFMGIGRVMFIYHYLSALVFAILLLVYLAERLPGYRRVTFGIALFALAGFGYFSPWTYGFPASRPMAWLSSWI
ncbi:MAG: phospholipid carrier-dependent glycosyltransferase [Gammaproteobacteria bacterium]|nr:phospholipid carrier-dependent glycosyltransferase [Gammaproteobacteria bacterium]